MERKNKKSVSDLIFDYILLFGVLVSLGYFIISYCSYKFPYEYNYYYNKIINNVDIEKITLDKYNEYYRDNDFTYVQNTKYFYAKDRQDLLNALYTLVNSGQRDLEFYCSKEYRDCTKDAKALIYDKKNNVLSDVYEFVHPFNDYKSLSCGVDKYTQKVVFHINKKYSKKKIEAINKEVDRIYNALYNPNDDKITNLRRIHDYLVNNIEYDKVKSDFIEKKSKTDSIYDATSAYGALIEHKAVCGGYTDAMYLFLDKLGFKSMRVDSITHIWNAVYVDGKWLHLDLTWDDGRYTSGKTFLSHKYFLVDTPTLWGHDTKSHNFDTEIYKELS